MNRGFLQRVIPFIFIILIIVLIVAAVGAVVRVVFGGGDQPAPASGDTSGLLSMTADRKVRMTIRGPIVGDEAFRSYQVTVAPDSREFVRYGGYLEKTISMKHYSNNAKAYDEFIHALELANLAKGTPLTGDADDTRGICATGQVHEYEIINGDEVVKRLWTSTCEGSVGSLAADDALLRELFLAQVPAATDLIGKED